MHLSLSLGAKDGLPKLAIFHRTEEQQHQHQQWAVARPIAPRIRHNVRAQQNLGRCATNNVRNRPWWTPTGAETSRACKELLALLYVCTVGVPLQQAHRTHAHMTGHWWWPTQPPRVKIVRSRRVCPKSILQVIEISESPLRHVS